MQGIALYVAGHYETEIVYRNMLQNEMQRRCPQIEFVISRCEKAPLEIL